MQELGRLLGHRATRSSTPVRTYSGGMRRKLEILRSLVHEPRVLFLDEPTAAWMPASRRNLWELPAKRPRRERHDRRADHSLPGGGGAGGPDLRHRPRPIVAAGTPDQLKAEPDRRGAGASTPTIGPALRDGAGRGCAMPLRETDFSRWRGRTRDARDRCRRSRRRSQWCGSRAPTLEDAYLEIVSGGS